MYIYTVEVAEEEKATKKYGWYLIINYVLWVERDRKYWKMLIYDAFVVAVQNNLKSFSDIQNKVQNQQ